MFSHRGLFLALAVFSGLALFLFVPSVLAETDDALELTPNNFQKIVGDPSKHVFVMFYAPWCGHCVRLKPKWAEFAKEMDGSADVVIAKIDASEHRKIAEEQGVRGFPTLKLFSKGNKEGVPYQGPRDVPSLINFVKGHM